MVKRLLKLESAGGCPLPRMHSVASHRGEGRGAAVVGPVAAEHRFDRRVHDNPFAERSAGSSPPARRPFSSKVRRLTALSFALTLSACTVGPDHVRPDTPQAAAFVEGKTEGYQVKPVGTALWVSFNEPELDLLIERALAANTDIAQAIARLDSTRALAGLTFFSWFPTVTASADAERSNPSGEDPFIPSDQGRTDTYRAGFDATWEIDLFGSLRRQSEAIYRRVDADTAALHAVQLSIIAETAQSYFALRGTQARLRVQEKNVENLRENLSILRQQLEAGRGTELDVSRSNALGLSIASQVPLTRSEVARQEQRLATLTNWPVATLREKLAPHKALPALPTLVAIGTPEEWLQRRPDVREAEMRLAEEVSNIGVETAEFFPKLTMLGGFGATAQSFGDLTDSGAQRFRFGPSLSWSFLDFGRVRQRVLSQRATADGALAAYQGAVLRALEETENALAAYRAANESAQALDMAVEASRKAVELAELRYDAGASDFLALLDAQRSLLDFEDRAAEAATRRATALAALYKALAGDFARGSE